MSQQGRSIIVINGCFSIGKTTIAQRLATLLPMSCVIEPDLFARFHPPTAVTRFDFHNYLWTMVFTAIKQALDFNLTCIVPVALVDGITSTTQEQFMDYAQALEVPIYYYHLVDSLDRVRHQNKERRDADYPKEIVEKCWQQSNDMKDAWGIRIDIQNINNRAGIPEFILEFMNEGKGLVTRHGK